MELSLENRWLSVLFCFWASGKIIDYEKGEKLFYPKGLLKPVFGLKFFSFFPKVD